MSDDMKTNTDVEEDRPVPVRQFLVFEEEEVPQGIPYKTPPKYHAVGAFNARDEQTAAMKAVKATRRVSKLAVIEAVIIDFAYDDEDDEATPTQARLTA